MAVGGPTGEGPVNWMIEQQRKNRPYPPPYAHQANSSYRPRWEAPRSVGQEKLLMLAIVIIGLLLYAIFS